MSKITKITGVLADGTIVMLEDEENFFSVLPVQELREVNITEEMTYQEFKKRYPNKA